MKYVYPAKLTFVTDDPAYPEGVYEVQFIDFESCYTFGTNLTEAYKNAEDILNLYICNLENEKALLPSPTNVIDVECEPNTIVATISADTFEYRKKYFI